MAKFIANTRERYITLTSTKSTTINLYAKSNTGRVKVLSWDGSISTYKSTRSSELITISLTVPAVGPYSGSNPKNIKIYGNTIIKYFDCSNNDITAIDPTNAQGIEDLITA